MNSALMIAISGRRLIEFVYQGGRSRIVEPHDYGLRQGVEGLLAYQISGASRSGMLHGWKNFDVDDMRLLRVLDRRQFAGARADSSQHHRNWDTLFARVK